MDKIPTAEEQLEIYGTSHAIEAMIEFTKMHVEAALTQAKTIEVDGCGCGEAFLITEHINSLIKTYPKELIK